MWIERLQVAHLRSVGEAALTLSNGINLFVGPNGAGKTSLLEAAFLLSHGRSFRPGARDALPSRNGGDLSVYAEIRHGDTRTDRLGLGRAGARWAARRNGETTSLGELVRQCAVVCFEPGSHGLIAGASEERRRYLDWGVFHVEHAFLSAWKRYQRALKQRNALLRRGSGDDQALFEPWEHELTDAASLLDAYRAAYLDALRPLLANILAVLLPELGASRLRYRRGWPDEASSLGAVLRDQRPRDLQRGHTTSGAHRADWSVAFEHAPLREHLSRGQEKLTALGCLLAQAKFYETRHGEWPIVCLDDLASELDLAHQASLVDWLAQADAQVLVTGTERPTALAGRSLQLFHVEQGHVAPCYN